MSDTFGTFSVPANKEASKAILAAAVKRTSVGLARWWKGKVGLSPHVRVVSQPDGAAAVPPGRLARCAPRRRCWTAPLLRGHLPEDNPALLLKASPPSADGSSFSETPLPERPLGESGGLCSLRVVFFFFVWLTFSDCVQLRLFLPLKMDGFLPLERSAHVKGAFDK